MESGDYVFSLKESLAFVSPVKPNCSLPCGISLSLFDEGNVGGSETMKELDQHRQNPQSNLKTGSKAKRKAASKRSEKSSCSSVFDPRSSPTLSDRKLENMTIKELNSFIRGIPKHQAQKIKKRRRILKNRKYAFKCRLKCVQKKAKMAEENKSLEGKISATKEELKVVLKQKEYYKSKYLQLQSSLESAFFK